MFWLELEPSDRAGVVRTFIHHVLPVTVDVLHGDTQPQLGSEQESLTGQAQRNTRAYLYHFHTYVGRMLEVMEKASL